jgi:hypothetical protein
MIRLYSTGTSASELIDTFYRYERSTIYRLLRYWNTNGRLPHAGPTGTRRRRDRRSLSDAEKNYLAELLVEDDTEYHDVIMRKVIKRFQRPISLTAIKDHRRRLGMRRLVCEYRAMERSISDRVSYLAAAEAYPAACRVYIGE